MIEITEALQTLVNDLRETVQAAGFTLYYPQDADRNALPITTERDTQYVSFTADAGTLRIEYTGNTVGLYFAQAEPDVAQKGDFTRLSLSLLEPAEAEISDVHSISDDFKETMESKFAKGKKPKGNKKLPASVSKTAVRNGAFYDCVSFGNRFTAIYPELRVAFKENIDAYGEFLPEEFFRKQGNSAVLSIIRENDPQKMKKLFNLLNEIYENGINDVQSLIAVTILGALENDETMIANCVDYMSDELCVNVIRVNKYLASAAGKSARMRLENPPRYKPKKARKNNMFSTLLNGGAGTQ